MSRLKIIASFSIKTENREELLISFRKVVDGTRKEIGCISYDLFEDKNDLQKYIILETWESEDHLDEHKKTDHYLTFKEEIKNKILSLDVVSLQQVY